MRGLCVAICFGTFPPERNGGADFVARFARALGDEGVDVHVITSNGQASEQTETGVRVHRVVEDWSLRGGGAARSRVRALLEEQHIDVLHVFFPDSVLQEGYQSPPFFAPRRTKLVTTWWNLGLGRRSPMPLRLTSLALLARSSVVSSHDPAYLSVLRRLVAGAKPVRWLPVGSNFDAGARRLRPGGPPTIGFFGQLDFTRGVDTLFDAVARLGRHDVRIRMLGSAGRPERYGDDPEFARLLALPERLGIAEQVEWTDFLADDEVPQALADLDVCVLPYRRNSLGRSALAAAFQSGTAVVLGGRAGLVRPLCPGRHVALVAPDDAGALAEVIGRILDDPAERRVLEDGARQAGRFFEWPRIAQHALEIYREALR
jgi:glycosyltransferase involved in cell wall biosynthesis